MRYVALNIAFVSSGVIICYIPVFCKTGSAILDDDGGYETSDSIVSKEYGAAIIASVTIIGIIIVDTALDFASRIPRDGVVNMTIMLFTALAQNVVLFRNHYTHEESIFYWAGMNALSFIIISSIYLFLNEYGGTIWRHGLISYGMCVCSCLSYFLKANTSVFDLSSNNHSNRLMNICEVLCVLIFLVLALLNSWRYIRSMALKSEWRSSEYCCVSYCVVLVLVFLYRAINFAALPKTDISRLSVFDVVLTSYGLLILVAVVAMFNARSKEGDLSRIARKVLEVKQSFSLRVSRQIRSPMQIVLMSLSLLNHRVSSIYRLQVETLFQPLNEQKTGSGNLLHEVIAEFEEAVVEAKEACKLACHTLEDLLKDDVTDDAIREIVCIGNIMEETLLIFTLLAKTVAVELLISYDTPSARDALVLIQSAKIRQVIGNMISNALKFSPRGSTVKIMVSFINRTSSKISEKNYSDRIRISVKDEGIGLSEENQNKLFKGVIQFNANKLQNGGGSGIGLLMCYGIMKMHGGDMGVHSAGEGHGCEFWIELPLGTKRGDNNEEEQVPISKANTAIPHGLHILCADDEAGVLSALSRVLVSENICAAPDTAGDGEEAVRLIKMSMLSGRHYDIVLLDHHLPGMDGPTAATLARSAGFKGLIIAMTSRTDADAVVFFRKCGANHILIKPIDPRDLYRVLKDHARRYNESFATRPSLSIFQQNSLVAMNDIATKSSLVLTFACLLLLFITLFLIFLPCWYRTSYKKDSVEDGEAIESRDVLAALIASFSISLYLTTETVLNKLFGIIMEGEYILWTMVCMTLIRDSVWLFDAIPNDDLQLAWSIWTAQIHLSIVSILMYLRQYNGAIWDVRVAFFLFIVESIDMISRIYFVNPSHTIVSADDWSALHFCASIVCIGITIVQLSRHFLYCMRHSTRLSTSDFCGCVYAALLVYFNVASLVSDTSDDLNLPPQILALWIGIYKFVDVVNIFVLSRVSVIVRNRQLDIIHHKRDVIRHVSHEIRTPLNIVSMGLSYLQGHVCVSMGDLIESLVKLPFHEEAEDAEIVKSVLSMQAELNKDKADVIAANQACVDCIAVLNDLLMYEKLESHQLVLEKTACSMLSLLKEALFGPSVVGSLPLKRINLAVTDVFNVLNDHGKEALVDNKRLIYAFQNLLKYVSGVYPVDSLIAVDVLTMKSTARSRSGRHRSRHILSRVTPIDDGSSLAEIVYTVRVRLSCIASSENAYEAGRSTWRLENAFIDEADHRALLAGIFDRNLTLFVSGGIFKLHSGSLRIKWNEYATKFDLEVDLPIEAVSINSRTKDGDVAVEVRPPEPPLFSSHVDLVSTSRKKRLQLPIFSSHGRASTAQQLQLPLSRLLCVDDAPTSLKMLSRLLKVNGVCLDSPDTATDGTQGLAKVKESMQKSAPYELVIIDFEMPVMDGPTAVGLCREAGYTGIVIGLTGNALQEDIDYFLDKGADKVIVKPIHIDNLKDIILRGRCIK